MAHDKVYAICENMCMEETMTKQQIKNLNDTTNTRVKECEDTDDVLWNNFNNLNSSVGNIKSSFKVLTGTASTGENSLNYPTGFTKNNTFIISSMVDVAGILVDSVITVGDKFGIMLNTNNILITNETSSSQNYKILLMRTDLL